MQSHTCGLWVPRDAGLSWHQHGSCVTAWQVRLARDLSLFFPLALSISLETHKRTSLWNSPPTKLLRLLFITKTLGSTRTHAHHPTWPMINSPQLKCYKVQCHRFLSFTHYCFPSGTFSLHLLSSRLRPWLCFMSSCLTWFWAPHSSSAPGLSFCSALSPAPAAGSPHWSLPAASSAPPLENKTYKFMKTMKSKELC